MTTDNDIPLLIMHFGGQKNGFSGHIAG